MHGRIITLDFYGWLHLSDLLPLSIRTEKGKAGKNRELVTGHSNQSVGKIDLG
jgi:hypothetical protein